MTINHALNYQRRGYVIIIHNAVRDSLTEQLSSWQSNYLPSRAAIWCLLWFSSRATTPANRWRVIHQKDSSDWRISKIRHTCTGFLHGGSADFFDVKYWTPTQNSTWRSQPLTFKIYQNGEQAKKSLYNERSFEVEQGTFLLLAGLAWDSLLHSVIMW